MVKEDFFFHFKDSINTYFVFVGMGNQHEVEKRGYFAEVLSRFGMERDPHGKDRCWFRAVRGRVEHGDTDTGGVGYVRVGEWGNAF